MFAWELREDDLLTIVGNRPNEQKLFYWLLYNHRETQLENYNNNVPVSKSDFHHLKPPNWGKRISTCQFTKPGRHGHSRTVSRFTVISNVPDMDEVDTVRSYDPYNASRVLQPCGSQVSHARIIVHRNSPEPGVGPSPTTVSHSYRSYRSVNGSCRQRARPNPRRTGTTGNLSSPQGSVSSIRSHHSNPRVRANNRSKRSVDFSNVRNKGPRHRRNRHATLATPASMAGSSTAFDRDAATGSSTANESDGQRIGATRSMIEVGDMTDDTIYWNEELEQLGHRIAQDCDEAFRSSLLLSETSETRVDSREASPFTLSLGTLSVARLPEGQGSGAHHPWDNRSLPPVPSQDTVSPSSIRNHGLNSGFVSQTARSYNQHSSLNVQVPERRVVSEPLYDRATKEPRPLPSIFEHTSDDWVKSNGGVHDLISAALQTPTGAQNTGLDYLTRVENTIRVVNSPSALGTNDPVKIPKPLNVRKVSHDTGLAKPVLEPPPRRSSYGSQLRSHGTDVPYDVDAAVPAKKRVSSWFKRASKDDASGSSCATVTDSSGRSKETLVNADAGDLSRPVSHSADEPSAQRKKSFGFAFWKSTRDELKMSLAGRH